MHVVIHSSFFCCSSILYRVDDNCHLILHQKITTRGIIDLVSFNADGATYLVIAHNANSSSQLQQVIVVSQWNQLIEQFITVQELNIRQVQRLHLIRLEVNGSGVCLQQYLSPTLSFGHKA